MKTKGLKVLRYDNLPGKLPIFPTLTTLLALEYWNAPEWLYGVLGVIFAFVWGASIWRILTQKAVDLLDNDDKAVG